MPKKDKVTTDEEKGLQEGGGQGKKEVLPTVEELASQLGFAYQEPPEGETIQSYHKALPGYVNVLDNAVVFFEQHGDKLKLGPEVRQMLVEGLADVQRFEPLERLTERVYQAAHAQRLEATDRCMEGLYQLTRRIREFGNAYPNLLDEASHLLSFMKAFKPGPKDKKKVKEKASEKQEAKDTTVPPATTEPNKS